MSDTHKHTHAGAKSWRDTLKQRFPNLGFIIMAAILMELIAAVQYWYTHRLLESELERNAESELRTKAIIVKGNLNALETTIRDHAHDASRCLREPDSLYNAVRRTLRAHDNILGAGIGLKPYYYDDMQLFEPWATMRDDTLCLIQLSGPDHDYTQMEFYTGAMASGDLYWSSPYVDEAGGLGLITTLSVPLSDRKGELAGVLGADVSLNWLGDTINKRHMYPSSFVFLMTEEGRLLAGPTGKDAIVNRLAALINDSTVARRKSLSGHTTVLEFKNDDSGDATLFYTFMVGKPHWQIAVVCYDDEVYSRLNRLSLIILLLSLAGLLLLGYIVYRSARSLRRLQQADVDKERINSELRIARTIQEDMLPERSSAFDSRRDIDVCGRLEPAKEVGGDLFDYLVRDEKLFFCIGDVSGKGVPSSLVMAVTHALFRSITSHEANPCRIMKALNEASCVGNESNMFVTIFVGVLDLPTGRLRYCNGGHDRPYLLHGDAVSELPAKPNLPIGLFADFDYQAQETMLEPGTLLFLYTDGLTEARNSERELFGEERLVEALKRSATNHLTPETLLDKMNEAVRAFADDAEQSDDLTMLALRWTPEAERVLVHETIALSNDVAEVDRLSRFVKDFTARLELPKAQASNLRLAIEEAAVNAINYAYPHEAKGQVTVEADLRTTAGDDGNERRYLNIKIMDSGVAFDPTEAHTADTTLSAEERPIGGLGILLMRELMDSINYERTEGMNILTLKKFLNNES